MTGKNDSLQWPFFEEPHRRLAAEARDWAMANLAKAPHPADRAGVDTRCRELVAALGRSGLLRILMGSVAEQVLRKAQCPVMVVRSPANKSAPAAASKPTVGAGI